MADQPDWQRYQSSSGPPLWTGTNITADTVFPLLPVGPWKSYKITQDWSTSSTFGTWQFVASFFTDAAGLNNVGSQNIIVTNGFGIDGWRPILGPYMKLSVTQFVAGIGETMTIAVLPSLLEGLVGSRGVPRPFIQNYEQVMNHNQFSESDANFVYGGPAILELRGNILNLQWDLYQADTSGLYTATRRWQLDVVNEPRQFHLLMPDAPVRVRTTNIDAHAQATFDVTLFPI
jgi:hypothetical protein